MNAIDIESIDADFNFKDAYKRNLCTLINIAVVPKELSYTFLVDMDEKSIQHPETVYEIVYREWQNKNWFKLVPTDQSQDLYWSSAEKGMRWFNRHIEDFGLTKLTRESAREVACIAI